jgi:NADP-dependent 3-hydroxy acid dehydrogenase YdfG
MKGVAVVTGASAGIGEATVNRLIEQGYTTYAAARRLDRARALRADGDARGSENRKQANYFLFRVNYICVVNLQANF